MKKKAHATSPTSFLQKTYDMVTEESLNEVISWTQDGAGFVINNVNEFSERVLPRYFKHNNLASFVRQLNMYDFHKCRESGQSHMFKHPLFVKGRPDLMKDISRKSTEANWSLMPKGHSSEGEVSPLLQKLYQLHKRGQASETQIKNLEERVTSLTHQNKLLVTQIMESRDRMKKIESVLLMIASYMQGRKDPKISMEASYLPITHVPMKSFEDFMEEQPVGSSFRNLKEDNPESLSSENMTFDEDKLDFLLDS